MLKPWDYLVSTGNQDEIQAPSGELGDEEAAAEKADEESHPSITASPGAWIIRILNPYFKAFTLGFHPTASVLPNQTVEV